jgi:hypothetical protein
VVLGRVPAFLSTDSAVFTDSSQMVGHSENDRDGDWQDVLQIEMANRDSQR